MDKNHSIKDKYRFGRICHYAGPHAYDNNDYGANGKKEDKEWIHSNPKSPSQTIGAIIRGFKGASTKKINLFLNSTGESQFAPTTESQFAPITESQFAPKKAQFAPTEFYTNKIFQRNYYEHIIRNQQDYNRIEQYILDNPKNWKKKKLKSKMNE